MIVKICGVRENEDLISISQMNPDYVGFIFVPTSPRDASGKLFPDLLELYSASAPNMKKVGVFVDEDINVIFDTIEKFHLNAVQLHGDESYDTCSILSDEVEIIKTIKISSAEDFAKTEHYDGVVSKFLFETAGPLEGGNGIKFDWSLLNSYEGSTPFLLSGGIGPEDAVRILEIAHPQFVGIDINSKFEEYPGKKNISSLTTFVNTFKPK
jgi:phosphoribosylanthranilate isomerase